MNNLIRKVTIGVFILFFAGCTNGNLPPLKTFKLESSKDCCKIKENRQKLTIKILEPVTNKHLNTTAIYYSRDKYLLQTYKLSKWSDYPVKMILEVLNSKLDELNLYDNIITSHIYSNSDYTVQSELISFQQNIENSKSYVNLKIKFYLIKNDKEKRVISKTFNYKVLTNSIDSYGAIEAFNKSIDLLVNELSFWLSNNTKV
ncbi:MAG: ABC-type transport auxiliary lipoprotein family protein [Campylobacterota bacterium]|nr:ABC-type transport auxiliary lipoprotein family protein [Campylobacterota bacterium]